MNVALNSGRSAIGVDISETFCKYILDHLEEEK